MKNQDHRSKAAANPSSDSTSSPQAGSAQAGQDLRRKAEALVRERTARTPDDSTNLSPDEIRDALHELRVHQIELEMQNEELRRAQAEIETGRARYFDLYNMAPVGYCTISEQGLILEANLTAATLLGTARSALLRRPLSQFIVKEDQDIYYLHRKQLFETHPTCSGQAGAARECELRLIKPDGSHFWAHLTATAAHAEDGSPLSRVLLSDITERKQAEETARREQVFSETIIDSIPGTFYVLDEHGGYVRWNAYQRDEIIGRSEAEAVGLPAIDTIHPDDHEMIGARIANVLKNGTCETVEGRVLLRGGPAFRWFLLTGRRMVVDGKALLVGIGIDITERKQAEEAQRQTSLRLQESVRAANVGLWDWDLATHCVHYSSEWKRQIGCDDAEIGDAFEEWESRVHPEDLAPTMEKVREAITGDSLRYQAEFRFRHKDGSYRWIVAQCSILRAENGKAIRVVGSHVDITEFRRVEEALREREAFQNLLMDTIPTPVFYKDRQGRYLGFNKDFETLYGKTKDQLVGKSVLDIAPPELAKIYHAKDIELLENPGIQVYEASMRDAKGNLQDVIFHKASIIDAQGTVVGLIGIIVDITARKRAEQALRQSEERNRLLSDLTMEGILLHRDAVAIDLNLALVRMMGSEREELLAKNFMEFVHVDDRALVLEHISKEQAPPYTVRMVRNTGESFFAEIESRNFRQQGDLLRVSAIRDITARKQAEAALEASEMRFKELLRNVPSVAVQGYALDGTVRYWNRASETFYGYTAEEAFGQNLLDLIIPPAMHDAARAAMRRMVEPHQTFPASELELMRKDGSLIPVYSSHALVQLPGQQPELFCIDIDLTERKRVQEANRESETKFRTLVEASSSGIWRTDAAGYNTYVSPRWCEIAGMPEPVAAGQGWASGLHPDDRIPTLTGWGKAAAASLPYSAEFRFVHPDGRIVWVLCQASPVMTGGHIAEWIGTITDISGIKHAEAEREALQAELTQAQKMESVGRLAGGVAHDFNNMLGIILGHTELAMDRVEPGEPLHADLAEIRMAAQRSADLTRQILAFARKQTIAPKVLDLNDTVEGMLKMLRRIIGEEIDLDWKPGPGLWPVRMDPTQIDQILANLCINARDAITGVGTITVSTRNTALDVESCARLGGGTPGEYVMLSVSDDGCGMDSETLLLVFDPFYTTKEIGKGTGLGLATVYGIVKQNHGFINASSEPGQGATFTIHLPRHAAENAPLPGNAPDQAVSSGHETILLVEDEPALLKMTMIVLESQGYTVLAAGSPEEAIRMVGEHAGRIDLLLTDVVMPGMNGRDLARSLLSTCPDLKRLFMSGYTADIIARHGVMDEGAHFIQKPFSLKDLAAKLREALDK